MDDAVSEQGSITPPAAPVPASKPRGWDTSLLRLGLMVTLLVAVGAALIYSRVYTRRTTLLRAQQQCLAYERPPGEVVYEDDPHRAAALLKGNDGLAPFELGGSGGPPVAGRIVKPWVVVQRWATGSPNPPVRPVLFLHERRTADGERGLVCVEADRADRRLRVSFMHLGGLTVNPTLVRDLHLAPPPQEGLVILSPGRDPFAAKLPRQPDAPADARADFRFFAGQADALDPTRITLPYEWNGRRGEIELWVQSDQTVYYVDRLFAR